MHHHSVAGREAHGNLQLLTYHPSLSKMLREGGLFSLKQGTVERVVSGNIGGNCCFSPGV